MKNETPDYKRNLYMLSDLYKKDGFDCWRHSFTARENASGEERVFFIDFFVINPALSPDKVILGQRIDNQRNNMRPSYVLIKAGVFGKNARQINNFYPLKELVSKNGLLDLQAGSCRLTEKTITGSVMVAPEDSLNYPECMSDAGKMRWDLQISRQVGFMAKTKTGLPLIGKRNPLNWNITGAKILYAGIIFFDGREYRVVPEKSYGYAEKIWGHAFNSPWMRIHCSNLKSQFVSKSLQKSSLVIGSCSTSQLLKKNTFIPLVFFNYEGKILEFNFLKKLSKSEVIVSSSQDNEFYIWSFSVKNKKFVLDITIRCDKKDMQVLNYEQPDGKKVMFLSGASGTGEIKVYQKEGKRLEALEHITFSGARCEYGNI